VTDSPGLNRRIASAISKVYKPGICVRQNLSKIIAVVDVATTGMVGWDRPTVEAVALEVLFSLHAAHRAEMEGHILASVDWAVGRAFPDQRKNA
jgi:hypothetical protein